MIRFVIGLFIFAVALCAYIVNTQHGGILPQSVDSQAIENVPNPVESPPEPTSADTTAIDLGYETAPVPVSTVVRDTLAVLGLEITSARPSPEDKRFAEMIGNALKIGTPDTEIIASVDALARSGGLSVPATLVRADQQIDTETYLKAVITTAVLVTENATPVVPDLSNDPAAIITAEGYDYIVVPTDSVASIAIKFYGDVTQTDRIIRANPTTLAHPEGLTPGVRLAIPAF